MYTTHQCMIKARLNTAFSGLLLYPNPLSLSKWRTWFEGSHPRTPNRLVAETRAKPRESLTLLSLKWLAKLTKFEDKAPTQPNCNNNNNPNSTCPFSTSTLHLIPYPKLLSLGLNKIFQNHFMRIFFCLCRKRSPCVLKTVIIKKKKKKRKRKKNANHSGPVSHSPHTASFLAHTARFDIKGRSARKEPHGPPKGVRTWPSHSPSSGAPLPASQTVNCLFIQRVWQPLFPQTTLKSYPLYGLWKNCFHF